jgi:hypothetical protein
MKKMLNVKAPNKYEVYITSILKRQKFITGKELVRLLIETFSIKDDNARKIIQRTVSEGIIKSSSPLTFGNGQFAYLLPKVLLTYDVVMQICQANRPPLYRLMAALEQNEGVLSYLEALKVSASPDEQTSSKVKTLNQLINELTKLEFVYEKADENGVRYLLERNLQNDIGEEQRRMMIHYNKMILDCMFIPDILRWLKKSNIIDNTMFLYRNKKTPGVGAEQNGLIWDALAYTKTTGINPIVGARADTIEKQTFVPIDIIMSRSYEQLDLDGFYNRVQLVLNSVKQGRRKVLPIVIYRSASELVLNKLAKLGFIAFDIASIFGSRIYDVIEKVGQIYIGQEYSEVNLDKTVSSILTTLESAGQEDNLTDLKGILFEFLMYPVLKTIYPNAEIIHGKTLTEKKIDGQKEYYEYDYIIKSSNPLEILIVEVKGYSSNANIPLGDSDTKNSLRWFFRRTLPFAQKYFKKEIEEGAHFAGTFITSAGYYQNGHEFLQKLSATKLKPKKMEIAYDGADLLELLENNDFDKVKKTIERFYMKPE